MSDTICYDCRVNKASKMWSHAFGWLDLCDQCYQRQSAVIADAASDYGVTAGNINADSTRRQVVEGNLQSTTLPNRPARLSDADVAAIDHEVATHCSAPIQESVARLIDDRAALVAELSGHKHESALIDADTQRGITDCSTPLFQRVRNIVTQLHAAEAERDRLRQESADQAGELAILRTRVQELERERDFWKVQREQLAAEQRRWRLGVPWDFGPG